MILEFFRFDLRYQLRTPLLWIGAFVFGLIAFGATSSDSVTVGGAIGNVHRNAPVVIVNFLDVFSVLGMLLVTAFIAGALLRDFDFGTAELFFATPMRKADYIFGRFAAGLVASLIIFVVISAGMMIGGLMPWIDPIRLGPFSLVPYLWSFAFIVVPNVLFIGALLSLLAATTRSLLAVYLGVIAFLVLWSVAGSMMNDLDNEWIATLIDPFAFRALERATRYWSVAERNTLVPSLTGVLLANRAVWSGVGVALLAATHALFKPQRAGTGRSWFRRAAITSSTEPAPALTRPAFSQRFDGAAAWTLLRHETWFHTKAVLGGVPFLVMLVFGVVNFVGAATSIDDQYGTKVYPVTHLMLESLQGSYTFLLILIGTFYAGELVWRERSAHINEVTDAMPVPDWVPLLAKLAALIAVMILFLAVGGLAGMGFQLWRGYHQLEPGLYAEGLLGRLIPFALMGALALVLQVLTNSKFVGYALIIVVMVSQLVMSALHLDHHLYDFAGAPRAPYSDMNGFGHFLRGRLWFQGYWTLFTAGLLVIASAAWVRGTAPSAKERWTAVRERLRGRHGAIAAAVFVAWGLTGAWIFYNTNVLNHYVPSDRKLDRRAEYEKKYRQYKDLPQPRITDVRADVDIYPEERRVVIRGHYRLVNKHDQPIRQLHVLHDPKVKIDRLTFAPADLTVNDSLGYRIYDLKTPMAPGESMDFDFELHVSNRGFTNDGSETRIVDNGTFFNNRQFFLHLGYDEDEQIVDRNERRKRGLGNVPRMPKLEDDSARANSAISHEADWITFDATVSTSPDQIAIAPGYLQREWTENGRRYFHYKMDAPMLPFFSYLSARWQVKKDAWNSIPIEVYYDAKHPYNVDRMIESAKKALDYCTRSFSPYQHRQVRILEFPGYEKFAQSFANTIPFSEAIGFIADFRDPDAIDYVFYVTAHEVAHQWWAHQVIGADMQGSSMLIESLAQYSALMVMEKEYGREKMRRFLKYELDRYLRQRGGELVELPLMRVENQQYIHYQKGSLVFYRLRDEIGEDALNRALSRFVKDKGFQQPPYANSRDLVEYIRAETPPDKQTLISDLFEKIIFYDNRATEATAQRRADGKYDVELTWEARKLEADGQGAEKPVPMDDWIDFGVFARDRGASESKERVLYLQKQHVTSAKGTVKVVVDAEPYEAGIDPYNKLIDRVSDDNRKTVTVR